MTIVSFGKVVVATPGTPTKIFVNQNQYENQHQRVCALLIQAWSANAGACYLGLNSLNKGTGIGLIAQIIKPTATLNGVITVFAPNNVNLFDLDDLRVDADSAGDALVITGIIA